MKADSGNWIVMGEPATASEAAALDAFREALPEDGITTAWVNLTFIDNNGRSAELDVLLLTRTGLYVVELKGWHGTIRGSTQRWIHGRRNVENPWLLTDRKAKRLASLLRDYTPNPAARRTVPYINALVVLHGNDSTVELEERARSGVLALDGFQIHATPPLRKLSTFLGQPAADPHQAIDIVRARQIRALCGRADFRATPKTRLVGDFVVADSAPIAEGPDWQDVLVSLPAMPDVRRRLRLYDIPPKAAAGERQRIEQLARREFQLTLGVRHHGIAVPVDYKTTDDGPALVFEYDDAELPLDAYLASAGADLDLDMRVALVIRVGELLRYAHNRHLMHRALAPRRVWVIPTKTPLPQPAIRDWYFGQKDRSTDASTRWTAINAGASDLMGITSQDDWLYLAPEARHSAENLPSIPLDVYGFGALAYLILTGRSPAATLAELEEKLAITRALDPRAAAPGMPDAIADVVAMATSAVESERPTTVEEVLELLRTAWDEVRRPDAGDQPIPVYDPLDAQKDDIVGDRFIVTGRRGEGSSGLALAVQDTESDDPDRELVLKVARSESATRRIAAEADVLRSLDHRRVVRLFEGPFDVDGRSVILLSDAGKETLATRLAKEGRSTIGQLEQLGGQLLEAVSYLESQGIFHRDIKPANLGITPDPGSRKPSLVLFDFSLASESVENLGSGTPGYLDPYLGRGKRHRYDRAAELYAVSATLFEMATGQLPWWGEGAGRPADLGDRAVVEPTSFESSIATQLTALFHRALDPDASKRFGSADQLADAWLDVFASLDTHEQGGGGNDELAGQATLETPLERAGLSARALSGLGRLDAATVGDLLGVHPTQINSIRGLGETYRKEIQARIGQWRRRLRGTENAGQAGPIGTERVVAMLRSRLRGAERTVIDSVLGLDGGESVRGWPATGEVAQHLRMTRERVLHTVDNAVAVWSTGRPNLLDSVRDEAIAILASQGRVMSVSSLVAALIAQRGSLLDGVERTQQGAALLRAVYELDCRMPEPALELRRRGAKRADLIALSETVDPDATGQSFPPADLLTDVAIELGRRADKLVEDGVVPHNTAIAALRKVLEDEAGDSMVLLADRRLLVLAASTSSTAMVSGFDELYRADLDPQEAVAQALRGKPGRSITESAVRKSVAARFPAVELPKASHRLDDLVSVVLPGIVNRQGVYELESTARTGTLTPTSLTNFAHTAVPEVVGRLSESLGRRGAVTLCVPPRRYLSAVRELPGLFDVEVLDVAALVVVATKELADRHGIDWRFALGVDAGHKEGADWSNLSRLVQQAVHPRWEERMAAGVPLLIVNAGPLVRYGMAQLLATLLDIGTPRPAARWLLVAMHADQQVPLLEGKPVPLGPSGWTSLPPDLSLLVPAALPRTNPGART
ncbi:BREX system serine/threonine kinase PglW [Kribbella sindirgiensis]|uniref:non-specific serine/threonine protein kinase n=1 Tax=Kribbella sindirgiensis TaxID=1124744 RepID=A0A4R0I1X3_9ACTN|nr:BREX system serine/threonine kinase PglW [Kribbella sindirgiensis]TCC18666.1 BREX system serine/threonine kinase PglW [Kribbella sindirgiensis]